MNCFCNRYCVGSNKDGPLVSGSVRSFVEKLGSRSSAPGGGSAAACVASVVSYYTPTFLLLVHADSREKYDRKTNTAPSKHEIF